MKIINSQNLPEPYVLAAVPYEPTREGRIRVTELSMPPQLRYLSRKHWDEMEEDVIDRVYAINSTSTHQILASVHEELKDRHEVFLAECALKMPVLGWDLTGHLDVYIDGILTDYKDTSIWKVKAIKIKMDEGWEKQQNVYAAMLRETMGIEPLELQVVVNARDWRKGEKLRYGADYPPRISVHPIKMMPHNEIMDWIKERVALHQKGNKGEYKGCTDEERWKREDKYAVMKKGRKTALRVLDSYENAVDWMIEDGVDMEECFEVDVDGKYRQCNKKGKDYLYIALREGEDVRCTGYCNAAPFCDQFKATQRNERPI